MRKTFFCIDAHTCGNPVRVIAGGGPNLKGADMMEKRLHFLSEYDWIRKGLMFEPRGHDMMSGSIIYPPVDPQNDAGILFIETSGCLPMCGHGTIGTVTIAIQEGLIVPKTPGKVRLETPAGLVLADYKRNGNAVEWVKLTNVKSFMVEDDFEVDCPGLGKLRFDIAYGGNFYAIIDPQNNFSGVQDFKAEQLIPLSRILRKLINEKYQVAHPTEHHIKGVSHIMWTGAVLDKTSTARNAVFYGDKAIDRSPCGTGTSARMAQWYAKGKLSKGEEFIHESFIGSKFIGTIEQETQINGIPAIVPGIQGWAKVYGYNTLTIDDDDPFAYGFQVI